MKILVDGVIFQLQANQPAGISRIWSELIPRISKVAWEDEFLFLERGYNITMRAGYNQGAVPIKPYGLSHDDEHTLDAVMAREHGDLLISTYYTRAPGYKNLTMIYDLIPEVLGWNIIGTEWEPRKDAIYGDGLLVAISQNTANDVRRFYPDAPNLDERMVVSYCGVSPKFAPKPYEEITPQLTMYDLKLGRYVLFVGNSALYKNGEVVLKAMKCIPEAIRPQLVLVGGNRVLDGALIQMPHSPNTDYLSTLYSGAVCLVYPSLYEGFGLPILEAMACGCPVIAGKHSSIPEVGGEAVAYTNVRDPYDVADRIVELMDPEVREQIVPAGIAQASKFSWDLQATEVVAAWRQMWAT